MIVEQKMSQKSHEALVFALYRLFDTYAIEATAIGRPSLISGSYFLQEVLSSLDASISAGDERDPLAEYLEGLIQLDSKIRLQMTSSSESPAPRRYPLPLVGEQHYQEAVQALTVGHFVKIVHEVGNPYDEEALVAIDHFGRTLGYIERDSFLHRAVFDEARGCKATVKDVSTQDRGFTGVILNIELTPDGIDEQPYIAPPSV